MADQQNPMNSTGNPGSSSRYGRESSSEEIRRGIDETRREMDETVDELQSRLRPRHLVDDILGFLRVRGEETGARESIRHAGESALDAIKGHPLPAALIGAGVAWLIVDQARAHRPRRPRARFRPIEDSEEDLGYGLGAGNLEEELYEPYGHEYQGIEPAGAEHAEKHRVRERLGHAREAAHDVRERARDGAAHAREAARIRVRSARERARRGIDSGREHLSQWSDDYPLAMGIGAMAAGLLAGLAIPHTHVEDEWVGEYSDRMRDRGRDIVRRGKVVAETAARAAHEEGRRQGLTPEQLREKGREEVERIRSVVDAGKEAARAEAHRQKEDFRAH